MPEGWKRAKEFFSINIEGNYLSPPEYFSEKDLDLMKEMAEALERIDEGYHTNIQECMNHVKPAIKKFKEWR